MNNDRNRYSMQLMPILLFLLLCGLNVVLFGSLVSNFFYVDILNLEFLLGAIVFVEMLEIILSFLFVLIFKITLTKEVIQGQGFLGFNRQLKWDQIVSVKPFSMLFQKYLRVYSNDGKSPLWLPLFLKNGESFKKKLLELAPEGNPLREFFEGYNF